MELDLSKSSFKTVEHLLSDIAKKGECVINTYDSKWNSKLIRVLEG